MVDKSEYLLTNIQCGKFIVSSFFYIFQNHAHFSALVKSTSIPGQASQGRARRWNTDSRPPASIDRASIMTQPLRGFQKATPNDSRLMIRNTQSLSLPPVGSVSLSASALCSPPSAPTFILRGPVAHLKRHLTLPKLFGIVIIIPVLQLLAVQGDKIRRMCVKE